MTKIMEKQTLTFELTDEQEFLKKTIRDIANKNFKEKAREIDKLQRFPKENLELLSEQGITGLTIPKEYGGKGLDYVSYAIVIEEISKVCAATSLSLSVSLTHCAGSIAQFGSKFLKDKYLKKLAKGDCLGAFCLSEPQSASDAVNLLTQANDNGNHFILNGTKAWVTNGSFADVYVVIAQTDPNLKHKGITAFVVEKTMTGVSFGKLEDKLGVRASATCQMKLDNVKVPKENVLGNIGEGFLIAMRILDIGRIAVSTQALGIAQASYDLAVNYAKTREAFGQKIINFQAVQFMLVELAAEIEAGRLLTYKAANMCDEGLKFTRESSEAKLFCSELASKAANIAVQVLGGYGYTTEYDAERFLRDARVTEIYGGTSEIQRIIIAENIIKELGEQIGGSRKQ